MVSEHGLSRVKACKTVKLSRSALYKPTVDWLAKDAPVVDALNEIVAKRTRWGFWKCFDRLRADGKPDLPPSGVPMIRQKSWLKVNRSGRLPA